MEMKWYLNIGDGISMNEKTLIETLKHLQVYGGSRNVFYSKKAMGTCTIRGAKERSRY